MSLSRRAFLSVPGVGRLSGFLTGVAPDALRRSALQQKLPTEL